MFRSLRYILFPVLNITAVVLFVFGLLMWVPVGVSLLFQDGAQQGFMLASGACLATACVLLALTIHDRRELLARDGFLLATIIWVAVPVFAALPLYWEIDSVSYTIAFFEAMSGTTTTCATALSGLDMLPESINFWRCFLSWMGGMGILVLTVAILPLLGVGGSQIFKAESSGPLKESRLTPRIADTAKGLWSIYLFLTLACAGSYHFAGMSLFDSIIHAFTTVSLGGFSSHDNSFAFWNSPAIESAAVFFMLVCGMSFSLHFVAWKNRSPLAYLKNSECLAWLGVVAAITAAVAAHLYCSGYSSETGKILREAVFNVVSTVSTTGFATTDFSVWPVAAPMMMFVGACFATCGGSTGGGMKMMRTIILFKQVSRQFALTLHPKGVLPVTVGGNIVEAHIVFSTLSFMLLWSVVSIAGVIALLFSGLDLTTAFSAVVACITNLGPGLGMLGPASNFSVLNDAQLWLCSVLMLAGRLELITVFVLFTRTFWRL